MALTKVTFPGSSVTAEHFGGLFAAALTDGRVDGAAITYSSGTLSIAEGYILAGGRLVYNNAALTQAASGATAVQVVLVINTSANSGAGSVALDVRTAASEAALAGLTQEDINLSGGDTYEIELALILNGELVRTLGTCRAVAFTPVAEKDRAIYVGTADPDAGTGADGDLYVKYAEPEEE